MIITLDGSVTDKMEEILDQEEIKTFPLGFTKLDELYKIVLGSTTYIGGIPSHGKSEWLFEMQIRLSEQYGFHHIIKSPESGFAHDIYLELACKYKKKVARKGAFNRITKTDLLHTIAFIQEHFIVHETEEKPPSPTELLEELSPLWRRQSTRHLFRNRSRQY